MKMMVIGLGKQQGANFYHRAFFQYGFEHSYQGCWWVHP